MASTAMANLNFKFIINNYCKKQEVTILLHGVDSCKILQKFDDDKDLVNDILSKAQI